MKPQTKHIIPRTGEWCSAVHNCDCGFDNWDAEDVRKLFMGWFQQNDQWMVIWECPKCFKKWYHHDRKLFYYKLFLTLFMK